MKNGFTLVAGKKELFLISDGKNITSEIVGKFIEKIGEMQNFSADFIEKCKTDEPTMKDVRWRIQKATIEKCDNGIAPYYKIKGQNFTKTIPINEAECLIIFE